MDTFSSIQYTKYKFEDFQKSEMIKVETKEFGFLYRIIATEVNGVIVILKTEREQISEA